MIQVKTFADTLSRRAIDEANAFLSALDPDQFVDLKFSVIECKHPFLMKQRHIAIIYRTKQGG
ncbi:sporulation protein Cse60 [Paenibacillus soyae]|uniref:Sporulation protein Cse60 n=1 Tax=Paenibacillus soyae TaxID=2969249 RepID=A0A9X2MYH2_9BACL|nr:sporulation protein Cse60 [Paenibacillus soyae]MCR2805797.1 sporulation protein Cse60 [Paenibacillus soyae]